LSFIDHFLDEDRFLKPFESFFSQNMGRPSIPLETYLRLMYLKFRHRLGFETLEEAVKDSIKWRIFCHIALSANVPDASTLEKLTTLFGPKTIDAINQELVNKLKEQKIVTGEKLRLDSTVMESNIHYPTDATLLGDCARVLTRHLNRLKKSGAKITFRNSRRRIKKLLQSFGRGVANRTKKAKKQAHVTVKKMVEIVKHIASETERILQKVQCVYKKKKETVFKTSLQTLKKTVEITKKIILQAEGQHPSVCQYLEKDNHGQSPDNGN